MVSENDADDDAPELPALSGGSSWSVFGRDVSILNMFLNVGCCYKAAGNKENDYGKLSHLFDRRPSRPHV